MIIGRWRVEGGKVRHLLYEAIENEADLYQKIEEMEEFFAR
jgi:hypothetical protein